MRLPIFFILALAAGATHAEPATLTLSDAQKEQILAGRAEADLATPVDAPRIIDRRPHGEVGVMIGTGGARGIYGATSVPLGENGRASFSFENSRNVWPRGY